MADEAGEVRREELNAEMEARRRTALAQIRQYGDPVLRLQANEVRQFDDELRRLAARMQRLMEEARGVGLAATQVGVLRRVLVLDRGEEEGPVALANPRIVERSDETAVDDEGCLSLGPVLVPVERHLEVTVEAQDLDGRPLQLELQELVARVLQHEVDHLDGVLILDRTTPEARREAMRLLRPQPVLG